MSDRIKFMKDLRNWTIDNMVLASNKYNIDDYRISTSHTFQSKEDDDSVIIVDNKRLEKFKVSKGDILSSAFKFGIGYNEFKEKTDLHQLFRFHRIKGLIVKENTLIIPIYPDISIESHYLYSGYVNVNRNTFFYEIFDTQDHIEITFGIRYISQKTIDNYDSIYGEKYLGAV